jgi:hypothetical protein
MSHLTCTNCGQKSPFEATKCKHCGRPFGRPPARPGDRRITNWIPTLVLLAAAGLIVVVAYQWWSASRVVRPSTPPESAAAVVEPPPPPARESLPAAKAPATRPERPARDSAPRVEAPARKVEVKDSTPSAPPPEPPAPVVTDSASRPVSDSAAGNVVGGEHPDTLPPSNR